GRSSAKSLLAVARPASRSPAAPLEPAVLVHLSVKDIALIDRVELDLQPGMTVLTGETGAGKSILVEALTLLLGGRASADVVRVGSDEGVVAGQFALQGAIASTVQV